MVIEQWLSGWRMWAIVVNIDILVHHHHHHYHHHGLHHCPVIIIIIIYCHSSSPPSLPLTLIFITNIIIIITITVILSCSSSSSSSSISSSSLSSLSLKKLSLDPAPHPSYYHHHQALSWAIIDSPFQVVVPSHLRLLPSGQIIYIDVQNSNLRVLFRRSSSSSSSSLHKAKHDRNREGFIDRIAAGSAGGICLWVCMCAYVCVS